jgi:hypothetical protein
MEVIKMITKEYGRIKRNTSALKKTYVRVGFISATALLLVFLSTSQPQSNSTTPVFAQEQNNNTNASTSTSQLVRPDIEIITEIRSLLNQTLQEYNQQNYAEAEAFATTAYIDNFEFIEAPLAEKDEALMENTEVMLREKLRQFIQNMVPVEEIQQHIDKINSNLDKAEGLLLGAAP